MPSIRLVRSLLFAIGLFALVTLATPASSSAQLAVSITIAPPMLPVYEQPVIPGPGYMWTPGYWAWDPDYGDYYWVPGTWVLAPEPGLLWTPGYWGWVGGAFIWNVGYWGPHIGFYGGVNYGYGYTGSGYEGGYWNNGAFFYNRSVNNITNVTNITNVYTKTVVNNVTVNNVSYNGGQGGLTAQPTPAEQAAASERHIPPTSEQTQQQHAASTNPALRASVNHGKPPIAATAKPGVFSGQGVVAAKAAAPYHRTAAPAAKAAAPAKGPAPAGRSSNPAGGGTRPLITAHPAPGSASHPATTPPRTAPRPETAPPRTAPRPETAAPRTAPHPKTAPPRTAPRPETAAPRTAPHPKTAPPKTAARPPAAQHPPAPKKAPPPSGEKPKEQEKPPQ
jgi:WXXGXW repeat (2 copies)